MNDWWGSSYCKFSLVDTTDSVTLMNTSASAWYRYPPAYPGSNPFRMQFYFEVDPRDQYELWISTKSRTGEGGGGGYNHRR